MTSRFHARTAAAAVALVAAVAALAPATAAASPLPTLLEGSSSGGAGCRGHYGWYSVPDSGTTTRIDHELYVRCDAGGIRINGLSELHYDLDLDTANGFDQATCTWLQYTCRAQRRMGFGVAYGVPMRHHVYFELHRTGGTLWEGTSNICTGAGTTVARCTIDQTFLAGSDGRNHFG